MSTPIPNPIKYSTQSQTLSLKTGDHWIGTGDVSKAPTSSTSYWNGMTPPAGGYTVYLGGVDGPAIFCPANDAALIEFTNRLAGTGFTTAQECMAWFIGQPDKSCVNMNYEALVTDGLVLNVDAAFSPSYPRGGTGWFNVRASNGNATLQNGPTFDPSNEGVITYDGADDAGLLNSANLTGLTGLTVNIWYYSNVGSNTALIRSLNVTNAFILHFRGAGFYLIDNTNTVSNYLGWTTTIPAARWMMLTGTWDGTTMRLYQNAVKQTNELSFTGSGILGNINQIQLGGYFNSGQPWTNGKISSFQIYNRAMTSSEIIRNYQAMFTRFYGADIVMDGLVSHLDAGYSDSYSGSGTTWSDISGYGRNGTLANGPTYSALGGGSIVFDGTNDFVSYDSALTAQTANLNGYHSVEIWLKADRVNQTNDGLFRSLNPASPPGNPFGSYLHYVIRNSKFHLGWYGTDVSGVQTISANTWYQVVFLYGEDRRQRIYVNGVVDATGPVLNNIASLVGGSFYNGGVGTIQLGFYSTYFQGLMSIVRVYNRGLTAAEVLQNFNAQKARFGL